MSEQITLFAGELSTLSTLSVGGIDLLLDYIILQICYTSTFLYLNKGGGCMTHEKTVYESETKKYIFETMVREGVSFSQF